MTATGGWTCGCNDSVQLAYSSNDILCSIFIPPRIFKKMCEWFLDPKRGQRYGVKDWHLLDTNFKEKDSKGRNTIQFYHNHVAGQSGSWWWVSTEVFRQIAQWYLTDQDKKAA